MNQQLNNKDLINLKDQLEQEYSRLTQEYKVCSVLLESKVRQNDILERQVMVQRELFSVDEELRKQNKEEVEEKKKTSLHNK